MDIYGDHALLCCSEPGFAGFQPQYGLVPQSFDIILRLAGICHAVEPPHLA